MGSASSERASILKRSKGCDVATQMLPANAQAWNHLGLAYHKAGQPNDALKAYEQARRCDLNLTPVRYNLGCLLLEQNNLQAAIAELTGYTLLQEDSVDGWLKLGSAQLRARQWDSAERSFQKALQLRTDLPEALNALGVIKVQRKRPKEALNCFARALQKQPAYAPALLNSAIVYQNHFHNNALALEKYLAYLQLKPAPPGVERRAGSRSPTADRVEPAPPADAAGSCQRASNKAGHARRPSPWRLHSFAPQQIGPPRTWHPLALQPLLLPPARSEPMLANPLTSAAPNSITKQVPEPLPKTERLNAVARSSRSLRLPLVKTAPTSVLADSPTAESPFEPPPGTFRCGASKHGRANAG